MKNLCFCFGLLMIVSTVAVNGHLNLFLNQHEVMRLLGKSNVENTKIEIPAIYSSLLFYFFLSEFRHLKHIQTKFKIYKKRISF